MPGTVVAIDKNTTTSQDNGVVVLTANSDFIIVDVSNDDIFTFFFTFPGGGTLTWTASTDGVTFFQVGPMSSLGGVQSSSTATSNQQLYIAATPFNYIRLVISGLTGVATIQWMKQRGNIVPGLTVGQIFPGNSATSLGKAEDAVHASGDVGVMMLGVRNDSNASFTSGDGDYTPFAVASRGSVYTKLSPFVDPSVERVPSSHRLISAASTNATNVKATSGAIWELVLCNSNAAIRYVKFYNSASAPTAGVGTPVLVVQLSPTSTIHLVFEQPLVFATGIGYVTVTGVTDADAVAVGASDVLMTAVFA